MGQQRPIPDLFWVVLKDDYLHVYTQEGVEVPGTFMLRLKDEVNQASELMMKMIVNIASSEEDMKEKIKLLKKDL